MEKYDKIIIGAGIYGLYAALFCGRRHQRVLVLECEEKPFERATFINQARVHQGYHYPRSLSTALRSASYFHRFNSDYTFCINKGFRQIYALSHNYSWTNGQQFLNFCNAANIPCEPLHPATYFKNGMCDAAFETREYTYDANLLKEYYVEKIGEINNIDIRYKTKITKIEQTGNNYNIYTSDNKIFASEYILNSTYASINQILSLVGSEFFNIKYELCEIILCNVNNELNDIGITVMDGPFFSIMPFGKTGYHSLTSVTFTPHVTCFDHLPHFTCQEASCGFCTTYELRNCNTCKFRPKTAFPYMEHLTRKYINDKYSFDYKESMFTVKPILLSSEIDDSRPTVIKYYSTNPTFISVLSGKINTVYDLDEVLE